MISEKRKKVIRGANVQYGEFVTFVILGFVENVVFVGKLSPTFI